MSNEIDLTSFKKALGELEKGKYIRPKSWLKSEHIYAVDMDNGNGEVVEFHAVKWMNEELAIIEGFTITLELMLEEWEVYSA